MFEEILSVTDCPCGKDHTLITKDYIVERDALKKLPALLKKLGLDKNPLAVFDANTYQAAYPKFHAALPDAQILMLKGEKIRPDEPQIHAVTHALISGGHSVILAVGSGVICDVSRHVACQNSVPFIAVPTAASVDGFVSDSAVLTLNGAKFTLPSKAPCAVVADLEIIAAAPKKLTASGVGDMLSKYISIADWHIGHLISGEYYCPFVADLEIDAVDLIVENIDAIGKGDIDSMSKLVEGLLLSGITMQMVKITRPASSFEHHFSHYLEIVPIKNVDHDALHGQKVGIGTIIAAKYYLQFAQSLKRIFEENLPNAFDIKKVQQAYAKYPQGIVDMVTKENTPTITAKLDTALLKQNYEQVLKIAEKIPSAQKMRSTLEKIGGYTDYSQIGLTHEQYVDTMHICCYIRNRFTMLRLVCDYDLMDHIEF
ncbi:MAG: sn-glycerol-1-phosphate dehydrogenase [Christensenellaceae bacterium]